MSYVFVSHASEDKRERVKPIVEALALMGFKLWLDRPGHGCNDFGFDQSFIENFQIRSLQTGQSFSDQINDALKECGAVLVCISKALCAQRQILAQELLLAAHHKKLVACVVDNIPIHEIPDLGLVTPSRLQAERIEPLALRQAVDLIIETGASELPLFAPPEARCQWEIVRKIGSDIDAILDEAEPRDPTPEELESAAQALAVFPIAPAVRMDEIPIELISFFADRFQNSSRADWLFRAAMQIRRRCNPEGFKDPQILVAAHQVLPRTVTPEEFWSHLLVSAGHKSRRTLGAFFFVPRAYRSAIPQEIAKCLDEFKDWLSRVPERQ